MKLVDIEKLPITLVETLDSLPNAPGFQTRVKKPYISIEDLENAPVVDAIPYWRIEEWNESKNADFKKDMGIPDNKLLKLCLNNSTYYTVEQLLKDWIEEQNGE